MQTKKRSATSKQARPRSSKNGTNGIVAHLKDLKPDPRNSRKHGERNIGMISRSLESYGAARSIVIDETGTVLAGNGVVEAAAAVGIERVVPVEASGNEIIAVVRRGLTPAQKAELSISDNRSSDLSEFDPAILKQLSDDGLADLDKFFTADELKDLIADALSEAPPAGFPEADESLAVEHVCPRCGCRFSGETVPADMEKADDDEQR